MWGMNDDQVFIGCHFFSSCTWPVIGWYVSITFIHSHWESVLIPTHEYVGVPNLKTTGKIRGKELRATHCPAGG